MLHKIKGMLCKKKILHSKLIILSFSLVFHLHLQVYPFNFFSTTILNFAIAIDCHLKVKVNKHLFFIIRKVEDMCLSMGRKNCLLVITRLFGKCLIIKVVKQL